jgi:hypothetical protein
VISSGVGTLKRCSATFMKYRRSMENVLRGVAGSRLGLGYQRRCTGSIVNVPGKNKN